MKPVSIQEQPESRDEYLRRQSDLEQRYDGPIPDEFLRQRRDPLEVKRAAVAHARAWFERYDALHAEEAEKASPDPVRLERLWANVEHFQKCVVKAEHDLGRWKAEVGIARAGKEAAE